jgi:hypothetical protein
MKKLLVSALLGSVVLPFAAQAAVSKSERALIVLSELDQSSFPELRPLYTIMERITTEVPRSALGNQYGTVRVLSDGGATLSRLKSTLYSLSANQNIKAIDLFVNTHGTEGVISFYDGGISTRHVREEIMSPDAPYTDASKLVLKKKLRMLYSTACFGATHNSDWMQMGFDVTDGSLGVNANAEVEYPSFVHAWSTGQPYSNAFRLSNTDAALLATDGPLRLAGQIGNNFLREVNSKKVFRGNTAITINSDAR